MPLGRLGGGAAAVAAAGFGGRGCADPGASVRDRTPNHTPASGPATEPGGSRQASRAGSQPPPAPAAADAAAPGRGGSHTDPAPSWDSPQSPATPQQCGRQPLTPAAQLPAPAASAAGREPLQQVSPSTRAASAPGREAERRAGARRQGAQFAASCTRFSDDIIGRGGFGVVCKGLHVTTGRIVAIKQIDTVSPSVLEETEREYELLVRLSHPNIVETYAFSYDAKAGKASIFMEYVAGGSLCGVIAKYRGDLTGLPEILIRRYTADILQGLRVAHEQGIIHRDIKPANMLLDTRGTLKLADFGLGKQVSDHTSQKNPNSVVGTVRYMSPGAIRRRYSVASDLWAVGCSITEMAKGVPPYHTQPEDAFQLLFAIGQGRLRPELATHTNGQPVSAAFTAFVHRCFDEDANDPARYPRATLCGELLAAPFANDLSAEGLPQPAAPRARSPPLTGPGAGGASRPGRGWITDEMSESDFPPPTGPMDGMGASGTLTISAPTLSASGGAPPTIPPPTVSYQNGGRMDGPRTVTINMQAFARCHRSADADAEDGDGARDTDAASIEELYENVTRMPNEQMPEVEEPACVLQDLLVGGCDDELSPSVRGCILYASLRFLAALFLDAPDSSGPYYLQNDVRETLLEVVSEARQAHAKLGSTAPSAVDCLLSAVLNGAELLQTAVHADSSSTAVPTVVNTQRRVSAAFLCPLTPSTREEQAAVRDSFRFLADRRGHALFTQLLLLLLPHSSPGGSAEVGALGAELALYIHRPDMNWRVVWAALEHLTQCALHATDPAVQFEAYFGRSGGIGLRCAAMDPFVHCEQSGWRLREKALCSAIALLHAETAVPLHTEVRSDIRDVLLPGAVMEGTDPRVAAVVSAEVARSSFSARLVYDWRQLRYDDPADIEQSARERAATPTFRQEWVRRQSSSTPRGEHHRSLMHGSGSLNFADGNHGSSWRSDASRTHGPEEIAHLAAQIAATQIAASQRFKYDAVFQDDPELPWDTFFARVANTAPYSEEPHFYNNYRHLFPLLRYLVQCEGPPGTGTDLNPPRDCVRYENDWKPFLTYFPFDTLFPDIAWLNEHQFFWLHAYGRMVDKDLAERQCSKGNFLLRPSKRETGKLVLQAVVQSAQGGRPPRTTHKIIYYRQELEHLVVDAFPVTQQPVKDRKLRGVRDLVEWLLALAPDTFSSGCGQVVCAEEDQSCAYASGDYWYTTGSAAGDDG